MIVGLHGKQELLKLISLNRSNSALSYFKLCNFVFVADDFCHVGFHSADCATLTSTECRVDESAEINNNGALQISSYYYKRSQC